MPGVKGRSGRRRQVSQSVDEALAKYRGDIEKLSDELYYIAKNKKSPPSVRIQAVNLFLEKCVRKVDQKPSDMDIIFTADDLEEYYSKRASERLDIEEPPLDKSENSN